MSEEQPVFKVTDRRLFNPDGTPREVERVEEKKPEAAAAAGAGAAATAQSAPASDDRRAATVAPEAARAASAEPSRTKTNPDERGALGADEASIAGAASGGDVEGQYAEDDYPEGDIPGAEDPASFINFLMSIASNAAAALGMMEHPVTRQRTVDPELAKHWIDVLGMLKEKTRGNLAPQEQQIFEGMLADLRMQYVSLSGARQPGSPRGFTGSDITGGR